MGRRGEVRGEKAKRARRQERKTRRRKERDDGKRMEHGSVQSPLTVHTVHTRE